MFDRMFADYLVGCNKLTQKDIDTIYSLETNKRVRLGIIAVSEKLMTIEQVNEVNQLQSVLDKRFGDIAVEKGYLNDDQVNRLLILQGNAFLSFVQAIVDNGYLSMEEVEDMIAKYQSDFNLTLSNIEDLKSCDVNRIIPIFLFSQDDNSQAIAGVVIRTLIRLIDYRAYIGTPSTLSEYNYEAMGTQTVEGDFRLLTAIAGSASSLKDLAIGFAGEENIDSVADTLDALCEFINCANGLYASDMSSKDINIDMDAPLSFDKPGTLKADSILCLPIFICGHKIDLLVVSNKDYSCT